MTFCHAFVIWQYVSKCGLAWASSTLSATAQPPRPQLLPFLSFSNSSESCEALTDLLAFWAAIALLNAAKTANPSCGRSAAALRLERFAPASHANQSKAVLAIQTEALFTSRTRLAIDSQLGHKPSDVPAWTIRSLSFGLYFNAFLHPLFIHADNLSSTRPSSSFFMQTPHFLTRLLYNRKKSTRARNEPTQKQQPSFDLRCRRSPFGLHRCLC